MKALDLFCGLGGWSDGLVAEGFEVMGVEIEPEIAALYKHPVIVEDVINLKGSQFPNYDLIVGSPPCRDFTRMCDHGLRKDGTYWQWKEPKNPEKGLICVNAFLRIVGEARPRYWLMENVVGLKDHLDSPKPICTVKVTNSYMRTFWGTFPPFLIPRMNCTRTIYQFGGKHRKWLRAKMPLPLARALGKAVKEAVT